MLAALDTVPPTVVSAETDALDDIAILMNTVYQQNIEPTQAGYIPKRIAAKLGARLKGKPYLNYEGINIHLEMWFRIMQDMDLIELKESELLDIKDHYVPSDYLPTWAALDQVHQTRQLLQQWISHSNWHDMAGINYNPTGWFYLDAREGRQVLLRQLQACQTEQWYSIDSLLEQIWDTDYLAMRADRKRMSKADQRLLKSQQERWLELDGEIYIGMLVSSLHDLGIVALGYAEAGLDPDKTPVNPQAFQISTFGGSVLAELTEVDQSDTAAVPARTLIVQPNFELLLLQPDFPTLYSVLPFTRLDQVGLASRLTLTQATLLRGLAAGKTIERIIQTLEEHSQKELPQNVTYTLHDWARQHREARISNVLLIEVSDEVLAQRLCDSAKFKSYDIRLIAPGILAVRSDTNISTLRNALDKEGIVVTIEGKFPRASYHASPYGRR